MLKLKVPFYGVKGSTCEIQEGDKVYFVREYDIHGKEGVLRMVPKKKKNYQELLNNFYHDAICYLNSSYDKIQKEKEKNKIRKAQKKILFSLGIILVSLPIGFVTTSLISYIFMIVSAAMASHIIFSYDQIKSCQKRQNQRKNEQIEFQKFLNEYSQSMSSSGNKKGHQPTKYKELKCTENPEILFSKKKDLRLKNQ